MKENEIKKHIIDNFIKNVPFDGWNVSNLKNSCKNLGLEDYIHEIYFPNGVNDISKFITEECNQQVFAKLKKMNLKNARLTEKVEEAVYQKILAYHRYFSDKETLKKFCSYSIMPEAASSSAKNIFAFSSDIWNWLDDKSTDFSYYTKRLSLSGIYIKTFIYSLTDESEHLELTRKFLKRSIDGLMKFHKLKAKVLNFIPTKDFLSKKRA